MSDPLQKIEEVMDLDRTNQLFDSAIRRADAHGKEKYSENDIKTMRIVSSIGNLHVKSAQTKLSVVRMKGYIDNSTRLKEAIDRKVRNSNKYGRKTD